MPSLYIGRFQPFHLGHLDAIKQALKESDMLYIGIGSANENYLPENPFTTGERIQMMKAGLEEAKIPTDKYMIIPVPNINNYDLWPTYIEQYFPPFEAIYSASTIVKELFENHNKKLKKQRKIIGIKKSLKISGTIIRNNILLNKKWEQMVPQSVATLLKKWNAPERIKTISEK